MRLMARGNGSALGELYDRYGGVAYAFAVRIIRDANLAEEVVQDGFLSLWRSAARFDSRRGAPRSWLLTLVHRRAVDHVRRASRRAEDAVATLPERADGVSTAALVESAAEGRRVRDALDSLPFLQRQALELAYYAGLTQSEIAAQVGVPLGTVKSRTTVALTTLRDAMSEGDR